MFNLGLTEDSVNNNLKDFFINLETIGILLIKTFFSKKLAITDEHNSNFVEFTLQIVWSDLIELQTDLLVIILLLFGLFHVTLSSSIHLVSEVLHFSAGFIIDRSPAVSRWTHFTRGTGFKATATTASTATTLSSVTMVSIVVATLATISSTTTASSTSLITCAIIVSLAAALVHQWLGLSRVSTCDDTRVNTHLDKISRKLIQLFDLLEQTL